MITDFNEAEIREYAEKHTIKECSIRFSASYKSVHAYLTYRGISYKRVNERLNGKYKSRLYIIYKDMQDRCYNVKSVSYPCYGCRGIKVAGEWNTFEAFEKWAYANGYTECLTIDRIDVNGDYSPENCRWCTRKEQANNKRNNVYLTYKGETKTLTQWSEEKGMSRKTLQQRLDKGYSMEEALNKPLYKGKFYTYMGKTMSIKEWSKEFNINYITLACRLKRGIPFEEAIKQSK